MYLGTYKKGEKVWVTACTHKFEDGEQFVSNVSGYYLLVGALFTTAVSLTFNVFNSEIGVKYAEIDTTSLAEGVYTALIEAQVDGVNANQIVYFGVRDLVTVYMPD